MCYTCLSVLDDTLNDEKINKLKGYFLELTPNDRDLITVSKIANALEIDSKTAVKVILKCESEGILQRHFGIRCPNCGKLIKDLSKPSLEGVSLHECYGCDEEINVSEDDIVVLFRLIKVEIPFECGQQRVQSIEERTSIVAQEDTLKVFKTMCEVIISDRNDNRFKAYQEKIDKEKEKKIRRKALKQADRNRKINIMLVIICIIIDILVIYAVYSKYGFSKVSVFTGFTGFIVPFVCNYIFREIFIVDSRRIEEKLLLKE